MAIESALVDKVESIAGVKAKRGLESRGGLEVVSAASLTIAESNPNRVFLSIVNTGTAEFAVVLGGAYGGTEGTIMLYPRGSLVLDKDMPWTGFVDVQHQVGSADSSLVWCEVSVLT